MADTTTADSTWAWRLCTLNPDLQQIDAEDAGERWRNEVIQSYKSKAFYPTYVKFAREELKRNEENKPTVEGLEEYKRLLRAIYLEAVSVIDKDLELCAVNWKTNVSAKHAVLLSRNTSRILAMFSRTKTQS